MHQRINFCIIGSGWRSEFFLRIAKLLPQQFSISGILVRDPTKALEIEKTWNIKAYTCLETMIESTSSSFMVVSVPWPVCPEIIKKLTKLKIPVLSETPPAPTLEGLIDLYQMVQGHQGKVQVAEQVHLRPMHQAQRSLCQSGRLGTITQAQISVSHGYHGISLMRKFLNVGFEPALVHGFSFQSPIIKGSNRQGPPSVERIENSNQDFFRFEYKDRLGLMDFTGDQYFGSIRNDRLLVRGERGEIQNSMCSYYKDIQTPLQISLLRRQGGLEGNLESLSLRGIEFGEETIYKNPYHPASFCDDEIAIADCLVGMDRYVRTGEDFYSLAEASQDHYLNLLAAEAIKSAKPVQSEVQIWGR